MKKQIIFALVATLFTIPEASCKDGTLQEAIDVNITTIKASTKCEDLASKEIMLEKALDSRNEFAEYLQALKESDIDTYNLKKEENTNIHRSNQDTVNELEKEIGALRKECF